MDVLIGEERRKRACVVAMDMIVYTSSETPVKGVSLLTVYKSASIKRSDHVVVRI
jgi:hypothetical protein